MKPHELTMTFANSLPLDVIVEKLEQAIERYKKDPTPQNRIIMANCCQIMLHKEIITVRGYDRAMQQMSTVVAASDVMRMQKKENG